MAMNAVGHPDATIDGNQEKRNGRETGGIMRLYQGEELRIERNGGNAAINNGEVVYEVMMIVVIEYPLEKARKHAFIITNGRERGMGE
jgi:hypothetical protein